VLKPPQNPVLRNNNLEYSIRFSSAMPMKYPNKKLLIALAKSVAKGNFDCIGSKKLFSPNLKRLPIAPPAITINAFVILEILKSEYLSV